MSWDSMMAAASSSASPNTYERYTSLNPVMQAANPPTGEMPSPKRGWLRKMNPFSSSSPSSSRSGADSDTESIASKHEDSKMDSPSNNLKRMSTVSTLSTTSLSGPPGESRGRVASNPAGRPRAAASFKFSLEWSDKAALAPRDRKLHPPQLPQLAQQLVDADLAMDGKEEEIIQPAKPRGRQVGPSKYCGRALAEWELLVRECQSFYDRRRAEGITDIRWMETPTLGVESFRRPVG